MGRCMIEGCIEDSVTIPVKKIKTPEYLFHQIPSERQVPCMIRSQRNNDPNGCRKDIFL